MDKKKIIFLTLISLVICLFGCEPKVKNGLIKEAGAIKYYVDGEMQTGWQNINDKEYYFLESGEMVKNTFIGDNYLGEDGVKVKNTELVINNVKYIFDEDGKGTNEYDKLNEEYKQFINEEIAKKMLYDKNAEPVYFEPISAEEFFDKLDAYDYGSNDVIRFFDKPVSLDVVFLNRQGGSFTFSTEKYKDESGAEAFAVDQIFYWSKNIRMLSSIKYSTKKQNYLVKKLDQFKKGDTVHIEGVFQWIQGRGYSTVGFLLQDVYLSK